MRAVVYDKYGSPDVLRIDNNVERPVPKHDEVLVRIRATTVNRLDCATREANRRSGWTISLFSRLVFGIRRPRRRILGSEFAGEVAEVGAAVQEFAAGVRVFGTTGLRFGTHAEFVAVRESGRIAIIPAGISFQGAAPACDGAQYALNCLRAAGSLKNRTILIYGASGAIGTAGVQLAKYFGAEVTAVCNTKNVPLVKSLGADEVIDYTQEDFTKNGQLYDVIFDAVGKHAFGRCKDSLKPGGRFLATDGLRNMALSVSTRMADKRVFFPVGQLTKSDVLFLSSLMEAGTYRPVIDCCYPLNQVAEAAMYVETEQKTGNVVLVVPRNCAAASDEDLGLTELS